MNLKTLSKDSAKIELYRYFNNDLSENYFDNLDDDYKVIRSRILNFHNEISEYKDYEYDLNLAIKIYDYFNSENWFNETIASNYDFWRYICVKVVPDIIYKRHGKVESYYFEKNVRMYIPTLWWYIHMTYQGDINKTYNSLKNFNTDYILQLVERPGRDGTYLLITRTIIMKISQLPKEELNKTIGSANLFRRIMIQHTAKSNNYNLILENEVDKYVDDLITSCKVKVG